MSTASNVSRRYGPAILGVAALAGVLMFFTSRKAEPGESKDESANHRNNERSLSSKIESGSQTGGTDALLQAGRFPKVEKTWSSASKRVLDYLRQSADSESFDEEEFTKLTLRAIAVLPSDERVRLLQETGRWFAVHAQAHANSFLRSLPTVQDRSQFASGVAREMFAADPIRAADWVTTVSEKYVAGILHNQIGRTWARTDLEAAKQWVQQLPENRFQAEAVEGIVFTWAQQDQEAAFDWIMELKQDEVQDRALSMMVKMLSVKNPESAAKWAVELPESRQASDSLSYAVQAWARHDVEASVNWLQSLEDPKALETVVRAVPMGWSNSDPAAAADWVVAWKGIEQQSTVLKSVVDKWGASDPAAAIAWLEDFPGKDVALRDAMVKDLFEKVATKEPSQAVTLLGAMGSDALRTVAQKAINTTLSPEQTP